MQRLKSAQGERWHQGCFCIVSSNYTCASFFAHIPLRQSLTLYLTFVIPASRQHLPTFKNPMRRCVADSQTLCFCSKHSRGSTRHLPSHRCLTNSVWSMCEETGLVTTSPRAAPTPSAGFSRAAPCTRCSVAAPSCTRFSSRRTGMPR